MFSRHTPEVTVHMSIKHNADTDSVHSIYTAYIGSLYYYCCLVLSL